MSNETLNDPALTKIMEGNFRADLLDAERKCVATGQARLNPGTNAGNFWPDSLDPKLNTQILGPRPVAMSQYQGPVFKVNNFELGDTPNVPRYFKFRFYPFGQANQN